VKIFPLIQANGWILGPLVSIIWLDFEFSIFIFFLVVMAGLMCSSFIIYQL